MVALSFCQVYCILECVQGRFPLVFVVGLRDQRSLVEIEEVGKVRIAVHQGTGGIDQHAGLDGLGGNGSGAPGLFVVAVRGKPCGRFVEHTAYEFGAIVP